MVDGSEGGCQRPNSGGPLGVMGLASRGEGINSGGFPGHRTNPSDPVAGAQPTGFFPPSWVQCGNPSP